MSITDLVQTQNRSPLIVRAARRKALKFGALLGAASLAVLLVQQLPVSAEAATPVVVAPVAKIEAVQPEQPTSRDGKRVRMIKIYDVPTENASVQPNRS